MKLEPSVMTEVNWWVFVSQYKSQTDLWLDGK